MGSMKNTDFRAWLKNSTQIRSYSGMRIWVLWGHITFRNILLRVCLSSHWEKKR